MGMDPWQALLQRVWDAEQAITALQQGGGGGGGGGTLTVDNPAGITTGGVALTPTGTSATVSVPQTVAEQGTVTTVSVIEGGDNDGAIAVADAGTYLVSVLLVVVSSGDNTNEDAVPVLVSGESMVGAGLVMPVAAGASTVYESFLQQTVTVEDGGIVAVEPSLEMFYDDPTTIGTFGVQAIVEVAKVYNA